MTINDIERAAAAHADKEKWAAIYWAIIYLTAALMAAIWMGATAARLTIEADQERRQERAAEVAQARLGGSR